MKVKDIITESSTDLIARFYRNPDFDVDDLYNPEAKKISDQNKSYYNTYFKEFYNSGVTPVFEICDNHETNKSQKWNNKPTKEQIESAGSRGNKTAFKNAGY